MRMAIIGGSGRFGSWYARFFRERGFKVTITGRNESKLNEAARALSVECTTDSKAAAAEADVVLLSTPIDSTPALVKELAPLLKEGALLADLTSVKKEAVKALESVERRDVELASIHPLHGPRVESVAGRFVLAVPVRAGPHYSALRRMFSGERAHFIETTAEEHDRSMAIAQGLSHFAAIVAGSALEKAGRTEVSTPTGDLLRTAIARVVLQDPALYAALQTENPLNKEYRAMFAKEAQRLAKVADSKDTAAMASEIERCGRLFKDRQEALIEGDVALKAIGEVRPAEKFGKLAVLGPPGTFSELAALEYERAEGIPLEKTFFRTIPEVFDAVESGLCSEGIVPVENMIEGTVNVTLDFLLSSTLKVRKETTVCIHNNLAARPGTRLEDIERVLSHPQPLAQCRNWLRKHLPKVELVETQSTSEAMKLVAQQQMYGDAAIGTELAAKANGLEVLARSIEDDAGNVTRFLVVAKEDFARTGKDRTSLALYNFQNRPGLLHDILAEFAKRKLNLSKIESRPSRKKLGEYVFYADLEGHRDDKAVKETLAALAKMGEVKVLGSYPRVY